MIYISVRKDVMFGCLPFCDILTFGKSLNLSAEELMLLNCGVGEDPLESLGLQGDPTSPF